jgi:hypothetical protein
VKTYANRKGHPVRKNRLKEECAFPDGGIWVQDSTWSTKKWTNLTNKIVLSGSHRRTNTFAKIQQQHDSSPD